MDRHGQAYFAPDLPLDQAAFDALMSSNALARRIVEEPVAGAMREGYELTGEAFARDAALEQRTRAWLRREHSADAAIERTESVARGSGRGVLWVAADDGHPQHEPLDRASLSCVEGLMIRDRWEAWPDLGSRERWRGKPAHWQVRGESRTHRVHASRLIVLDGVWVPDRVRRTRLGAGLSVLELVYSELRNWGTSQDAAAEALTLLTQGIFEVEGLSDAIAGGDAKKLAMRYAAIKEGLGTLGDIVIDKRDGYRVENRTFAGLGDAAGIGKDALAIATGIPRLVLFGESPPGLSGTVSGEVRMYYDRLRAMQSGKLEDPLLELLGILLAQPHSPTGGVVPEDLGLAWRPVYQPTPAEVAELQLKQAQRRAVDARAALLTVEELRSDTTLEEVYTLARAEQPSASVVQLARSERFALA